MKHKAFAIWDAKAEAYLPSFVTISSATAMREIADIVNRPEHQFNKHSQDFTLYEIGEYDDQKGCYENLLGPKSLINLKDLKQEGQQGS